jgi:rhodanese-related sulfurtransferase
MNNRLAVIESIYNFIDFGVVMESFKNSLKVKMEMRVKDFLKHLIFGKGYNELTPPQLIMKMETLKDKIHIVDLRDKNKFEKGHIKGATLYGFDEFLKDVLMNTEYHKYKNKPLILVCDTGHQSRVAASILADEGFLRIYSLNRGMRRWNRWQTLLFKHMVSQNKRIHICKLI